MPSLTFKYGVDSMVLEFPSPVFSETMKSTMKDISAPVSSEKSEYTIEDLEEFTSNLFLAGCRKEAFLIFLEFKHKPGIKKIDWKDNFIAQSLKFNEGLVLHLICKSPSSLSLSLRLTILFEAISCGRFSIVQKLLEFFTFPSSIMRKALKLAALSPRPVTKILQLVLSRLGLPPAADVSSILEQAVLPEVHVRFIFVCLQAEFITKLKYAQECFAKNHQAKGRSVVNECLEFWKGLEGWMELGEPQRGNRRHLFEFFNGLRGNQLVKYYCCKLFRRSK